jgi:putative acetyltransferase
LASASFQLDGSKGHITTHIRKIRREDNPAVAAVVREVMTSFGADPDKTVLGDPTLDHMFENYQMPGCVYYVTEVDGLVKGGCGLAPLEGGDGGICELQRMFLLTEVRGKGIGKSLLERCVADAREFGYRHMYIESFSDMHQAIRLYTKTGFKPLKGALGSTGHTGCNVHMILGL